jgi:hypothetical protein
MAKKAEKANNINAGGRTAHEMQRRDRRKPTQTLRPDGPDRSTMLVHDLCSSSVSSSEAHQTSSAHALAVWVRIVGPDRGEMHVHCGTGHLAPPSVAFEGRKSARFCWVS